MPVSKPIASSMKTRSSVAMLPLAPGACGQPPRPPSEASNERMPTSSAATTLARPGAARVVEMGRVEPVADGRPHLAEQAADLGRVGVADRVGKRRSRRRRPRRRLRRSAPPRPRDTSPWMVQPKAVARPASTRTCRPARRAPRRCGELAPPSRPAFAAHWPGCGRRWPRPGSRSACRRRLPSRPSRLSGSAPAPSR